MPPRGVASAQQGMTLHRYTEQLSSHRSSPATPHALEACARSLLHDNRLSVRRGARAVCALASTSVLRSACVLRKHSLVLASKITPTPGGGCRGTAQARRATSDAGGPASQSTGAGPEH